jgi:large subunit ribosomal protein L23
MKTPYDIVIKPVITENSMMEAANKKYTFRVHKDANKTEIKLAVQEIFDVKVVNVNTLNVRGKMKRQGKYQGFTSSWKKAIVELSADSKEIEFFAGI